MFIFCVPTGSVSGTSAVPLVPVVVLIVDLSGSVIVTCAFFIIVSVVLSFIVTLIVVLLYVLLLVLAVVVDCLGVTVRV